MLLIVTLLFTLAINPEGSNFSYEELRQITEQSLFFYEQATGIDIPPVTQTTETRGTFTNRVISFFPKEHFSRSTIQALAAAGIQFNRRWTDRMSLSELRWLMMQELGHNFGLRHDPWHRFTVMTNFVFRLPEDSTLLWRQDLINLGSDTGLISVDEDLRIMIPAVTVINGETGEPEQWEARLRVLKPGVWIVYKSRKSEDGVHLIENARLTDNDELILVDVNYLCFIYPLVRFKITPDLQFILIP